MKFIKDNILYVAWTVALTAMLGSLYFSEFAGFPPCVLCWHQRILMYPLVIILGVGILRRDKLLYLYALPFTIIGMGIATFHNLLYYKILPESAAPCTAGVSCTTKFIEYFGFITIPFLSLTAFTVITVCLVIYWRMNHEQRS